MIVGTCARSPAPATSPTVPSFRCVDGVLHVAVEVEAPGAALAPDARLPGPAERRAQVADEEAVDPDGPRHQPGRHPRGPLLVAGEHRRRQPVAREAFTPDGAPAPEAPRTVARRVAERIAGLGYELACGPELEFYLCQQAPDGQ